MSLGIYIASQFLVGPVWSWFLIADGNMSRGFHLVPGNSEQIHASSTGPNDIRKTGHSNVFASALGHRHV